jgi:hypothetical protein
MTMVRLIDRLKNRLRKQEHPVAVSQDAGQPALLEKSDVAMDTGGDGHHGKLVVVGRESEFPRELVDYALDMAERLSYEIVALNTAPLSCDTFKFLLSSRSRLCQDFQALSEKSAAGFKAEVARRDIAFTHVVKFSDVDDALAELQDEIGGIDFIVSDVQETVPPEAPLEGERLQSEIVVYAMVR